MTAHDGIGRLIDAMTRQVVLQSEKEQDELDATISQLKHAIGNLHAQHSLHNEEMNACTKKLKKQQADFDEELRLSRIQAASIRVKIEETRKASGDMEAKYDKVKQKLKDALKKQSIDGDALTKEKQELKTADKKLQDTLTTNKSEILLVKGLQENFKKQLQELQDAKVQIATDQQKNAEDRKNMDEAWNQLILYQRTSSDQEAKMHEDTVRIENISKKLVIEEEQHKALVLNTNEHKKDNDLTIEQLEKRNIKLKRAETSFSLSMEKHQEDMRLYAQTAILMRRKLKIMIHAQPVIASKEPHVLIQKLHDNILMVKFYMDFVLPHMNGQADDVMKADMDSIILDLGKQVDAAKVLNENKPTACDDEMQRLSTYWSKSWGVGHNPTTTLANAPVNVNKRVTDNSPHHARGST